MYRALFMIGLRWHWRNCCNRLCRSAWLCYSCCDKFMSLLMSGIKFCFSHLSRKSFLIEDANSQHLLLVVSRNDKVTLESVEGEIDNTYINKHQQWVEGNEFLPLFSLIITLLISTLVFTDMRIRYPTLCTLCRNLVISEGV